MPEHTEPSLTALADAAFRQAAAKLIRRAKQTGTPLIVWDGNQVRAIPPDELPDEATFNPSLPTLPHPERGTDV